MKCFEVTINGRKLCTAGVENGVLTAILSYVKRESVSGDAPENQAGEYTESLDIRVGGLADLEPGTSAHVDWLTQDISIGDEITIRVIEATACDEPLSKEITYMECSFCGKKQSEVDKLIAGPAVHICDECVGHCSKAILDGEPTANITMVLGKQAEAPCSFCGLKPLHVVRIVGIPTARICNQCIKICGEILEGTA